jgi:hypothetical protein
MSRTWIAIVLAAVVAPGLVLAEGDDTHHAGDDHGAHRHHVGLFVGAGVETKRDGGKKEKGPAIGLEYEWRFKKKWGVGGAVEALGGESIRDLSIVAPVSFHPAHGWRLFAGPGHEFTESKDHFLLRAGVGYMFHLNERWSI